jgi:hypothetical protein
MSELTDLEKLKQEVENLKKYLTTFESHLYRLYDELYEDGYNWEESIKIMNDRYAFLHYIADDLFNANNINNYYDRDNEGEEHYRDLLKIMRENAKRKYRARMREHGETFKMSKQDFSVSKGGKRKTRKNRKSRK